MKHLVTGKEMKLLDQNTSTCFHVPTVVLMEQAAMTFVREFLSFAGHFNRVLVVCGTGNNGADGIAIARLLNQQGYSAHIQIVSTRPDAPGTELFELQKKIYQSYGYAYGNLTESYDVIIDALFGIGLSRPLAGIYADTIALLNKKEALKVAVDMASGVHSDNGEILGCAFTADHTITFSFGKIGQYLYPGCNASGKVHVVPMGITADSMTEGAFSCSHLEQTDLAELLPKRRAHSNKGTYGKLLIIAGSPGMSGAAYFAAKAAYRMGTGLVRILTAECNRSVLQTLIPEAVLITYDTQPPVSLLADQLSWADALVLGPGLGTGTISAKLTGDVLEYIRINKESLPVIIDADGLNLIAADPLRFALYPKNTIITPHLGEMSRLTGLSIAALQKDLPAAAKAYTDAYGVITVLKDFRTVTALGPDEWMLNLSGTNGMATAGSGDVLSGIIGALLAQKLPAKTAAPLGVFLHGLAGEYMAGKKGDAGLMASDIIEGLTAL